MKAVGQSVPHEGARGHVTGEALYTDDRLRRYPRIVYAWPVMAPHANAEVALAESPHELHGELQIGGQEHFYLETQCAIAWLDETGCVALHSSTQHPSETQEIVSRVLARPRNEITVECLRMGGAFGGKETQANTWAAIAALGAVKTGRPVRVRLPRRLDMVLTGKRHPFLARFHAGFDDDGVLHALQASLYSDAGWSLDLSVPIMWRLMVYRVMFYLVPSRYFDGIVGQSRNILRRAVFVFRWTLVQ